MKATKNFKWVRLYYLVYFLFLVKNIINDEQTNITIKAKMLFSLPVFTWLFWFVSFALSEPLSNLLLTFPVSGVTGTSTNYNFNEILTEKTVSFLRGDIYYNKLWRIKDSRYPCKLLSLPSADYKDAYSKWEYYHFCTINIDIPLTYDLKFR